MKQRMKRTVAATLVAMTWGAVAQETPGTVRVFILAGQSNMVGHGKPDMGRNPGYDPDDRATHAEVEGGIGSLRWFVGRHPGRYGATGMMPLLDAEGRWREREDVLIRATVEQQVKKGRLSTGFGKGQWFGPELGFGHVVGDASDEPVLIIKTAWGGKSLAVDFRPPSAGPYEFPREVVERWRNNPGGHGVPGDVDRHLTDTAEASGHYYRVMIETVRGALANLDEEFPELKGRTPRIAGFGWHQGWNDGCDQAMTEEYERNMVRFIRDVRKDLDVPNLPFVIANTGMNGWNERANRGTFGHLCKAQLAIGDPTKHPEFSGTVASVETRDFKRPTEQSPSHFGFHWNHNGESHFLVGEAMGKAMVKLLQANK